MATAVKKILKGEKPKVVRDTPLEQVSMDWARAQILKNLFRRFDGSRPDLQPRLEAAYREKYGVDMRKVRSRDVRAIYLESPPGHGKTTIHREALRDFSKLMKMKFVDNPSMQMMMRGQIDENSCVFSAINLGGATSKHEIGGLMAKLRVNDQEFMGHLPDWRMAATMMGGYGYILFDDYVTSSHQVQNACLDMLLGGSAGDMQFNVKDMAASKMKIEGGQVTIEFDADKEKAINELGGGRMVSGASPVHVGLAGNRGVRDGNKTFPIVTATATRLQRMDVFDTPEAFISRALSKHDDELGDAHYSVFIKQNPEVFSIVAKPQNGILPQMPCPRSHDALMDAICDLIHDHGGMASIANDVKKRDFVVQEIERMAGTHIGRELTLEEKGPDGEVQWVFPATLLSGFYSEMFLGAVPLAEEVIKEGKIDEEKIKGLYNNGNDSDGQNFGYRFASALAQVAASTIADKIRKGAGKKDGKKLIEMLSDAESPLSLEVRGTLKNLSMGVTFLQKVFVSFALDRFNQRLATMVPEIYEGTTYKILPSTTMRTVIFGLVKDNTRYMTDDLRDTFVDAISMTSSAINAEMDGGRDATINNALKKYKDSARAALKEATPA